DNIWSGLEMDTESEWVLDFGCTNHTGITSHQSLFLDKTFMNLPKDKHQIRTATGELVSAAGIGNIRIPIWLPGQGRKTAQLCDVLYVPDTGITNLISVSQLTQKGMSLNFPNNKAEIYKDGVLTVIALKANRMYTIIGQERAI